MLLLGLSEIGLVSGLIGLGGLNPLRISGGHCDVYNATRELGEKERSRRGIDLTTETRPKGN